MIVLINLVSLNFIFLFLFFPACLLSPAAFIQTMLLDLIEMGSQPLMSVRLGHRNYTYFPEGSNAAYSRFYTFCDMSQLTFVVTSDKVCRLYVYKLVLSN